ncbi:MAG: 50S ribosomal protein L10 [Bacteroidetes bacterium]|nr:50S ribosomal protein L10 [Bacteroidota bacterium]
MKRIEKEAIISEVAEKASRAVAMYFADFSGLTVEQETELRREFRKSGIEYNVVKNTLAQKALEQLSGYDRVFDKLVGPTGIAFSYDDPSAPAKIIKKYSDKLGKFKLKAAVIEKQIYEAARLNELASMPSRKDMIAAIIGSIQAPASGIAGAIGAVARDLVYVLDAIEKKKAA